MEHGHHQKDEEDPEQQQQQEVADLQHQAAAATAAHHSTNSDGSICRRTAGGGGGGKLLHGALLVAQGAFAGFEILSRVTLDKGAGKFAFSFYRNCVATLVLGAAACLLESKEWHKLSFMVVFKLFFLGLTGVTLNQILYLAGLGFTSPVFASAMRNTTPVFTFLLAWLFRLEHVKFSRSDGMAKLAGCLLGIVGSAFLSIYRGPVVLRSHFSLPGVNSSEGSSSDTVYVNFFHFITGKVAPKTLGSVYLIGSCFSFSIFLILQAKLLKKYPAPISCAAFMCFFSVVQLPPLAFLFEPDRTKWRVTTTEVISIVYSGVIASGFVSGVQSWAVQRGGPVIVAAYQPLETTITAVLGFFFVSESLRMGSILGGTIVIIGLYLLIWGQSREHNLNRLAAAAQSVNDREKQQVMEIGGAGLHELPPSMSRNSTEIRCVSLHDSSLRFDFYLVEGPPQSPASNQDSPRLVLPAPIPIS